MLTEPGKYQVGITYGALANRATNVPVIVHHADGETKVIVNQRKPAGEKGLFPLGEFRFVAGKSGWVEIRNDGTDGHVIVDAVRWGGKGGVGVGVGVGVGSWKLEVDVGGC